MKRKQRRLLLFILLVFMIIPFGVFAKSDYQDYQMLYPNNTIYCDENGNTAFMGLEMFKSDPYILKGRVATEKEVAFYKEKVMARLLKEKEEYVKSGYMSKDAEVYSPLDVNSKGERLINYLILDFKGKKVMVANTENVYNKGPKSYTALDLTEHAVDKLVDRKTILNTYTKDSYNFSEISPYVEMLDEGHYIGRKASEMVSSFKVDKSLPVEKQLYLALYKYATLGLEYDKDGSGYNQFATLDDGKGMCLSMSTVLSRFLEKTNVPYRMISRYYGKIGGTQDEIGHAYLEVKLNGKWKAIETTGIQSCADAFLKFTEEKEQIEIGKNLMESYSFTSVFEEVDKIRESRSNDYTRWKRCMTSPTYAGGKVIDNNMYELYAYYY